MTATSGSGWRRSPLFLLITLLYLCQATIPRSQPQLRTTLGTSHSLTQRQAAFDNHCANCTCPQQCFCQEDPPTRVTCHSTSIPTAIPSSTIQLTVSGNLTKLDDSNLASLHQLQTLSLVGCNLSEVSTTAFSSLIKLEFLDLSNNQLSRTIPPSVFHNLANLKGLNLSVNTISSISNEFLGLESLATLDLSHNAIADVDEYAFQSLNSLQWLDLSYNKLTNLSAAWFRTLSRLKVLLINHNQVLVLEDHLFQALPNLEVLSVSGNEIVHVRSQCLAGLANLKHLHMDNNNISQIANRPFDPLVNLENLNLSANPLTTISSTPFSLNSNLTVLHLNHLPNLTNIVISAFTGAHQLKTLTISNNPSLHFIHPDSLTHLKSLQRLDLSGNNLTALHHHTFANLPNLTELALYKNPWNCDCFLDWLPHWLNQTSVHIIHLEETRCATPSAAQSHSIFQRVAANCSNTTISNFSSEVYSRIGSSALLECQAVGNPPPSLTWVLPKRHVFHLYPPGLETHWFIPYEMSHSPAHVRNRSSPDPYMTDRIRVLKNGNLYISQVLSIDAGTYICMASNALGNDTTRIKLTLNYQILIHVKLISILVGLATSIASLLMLLIFQLINMALNRWGCCCCQDVMSPKAKQIRKMLEGIEQYKSQQLERLRENYTMQVSRIKDNCTQQMDRIRDSYGTQVDRFRDIRDYGTQQIDKVRDQYYEQVKRVRDYSSQQMSKVRENYVFQRNRIRKFSAHQLIRLRENYKLQQQHLNKILETLNIENCRTGCSRSVSIDFNEVIGAMPVFDANIDSLPPPSIPSQNSFGSDQQSIESDYYTPDNSPAHDVHPKCPPPTPITEENKLDTEQPDQQLSEQQIQDVQLQIADDGNTQIEETLTELVIDYPQKPCSSSIETSV